MPLPSGTRLGPYEILAPLGAGGMGEVYRARDPRLNRDVAVKLLPASVAADPDRLRRFTVEAQTTGALNHPNILAVYDWGSENGQTYLVAELLQGETLRAKIDAGAIPVSKAIDYVRQAAAGLGAAHASGVTHRDIKPENLFVTADGRMKILDFGLARALSPDAPPRAAEETRLNLETTPGVVLGTVGYMSPEQVRGLPADPRSDLFSLGVVLYELLAGKRPFAGDSAVQTMNAVLTDDPPDLTGSGPQITPALAQVVRHCLEKNPEERFQSARDLSFALQTASSSSSPSGSHREATAGKRRALVWSPISVLIALAVVAAGAFAAGRWLDRTRSASAQVVSFQQLTDRAGVETTPTMNPDGKTVVYVSEASGNADLYSMRVGGRTAVNLTPDSPSDDTQPAFSPEGERIAFRSTRDGGGIFVMSASGESVRRLADTGFYPSWSPDGRELVISPTTFAYPTDRPSSLGGLTVIDVATGHTRVVSKAADAMQPSWSPHGTRIAYWGLRVGTGQRDLFTIAADGSDADREGTTVTNDPALDWSPTWSPDGRYLYFSSNRGGPMTLWRLPIDEASGRALGDPEPVTTPSTWSGNLTFSRDGSRLAFASLDWRSTLLRAALDLGHETIAGAPAAILKSTRPIRDHEVSPDGQWIAYGESSPQEDIVLARVDGSEYRRLTDDAFRDRGPAWSPDGRRIAFYSDRSGAYEAWMVHPDGLGLEQISNFQRLNFPTWSPDGLKLAVSGVGAGGWYIIDSDARSAPRPPPEPATASGQIFWPFSWSKTGQIAGMAPSLNGSTTELMTFSLQTRQFHIVPDGTATLWQIPLWADDTRLIVRDTRGIWVVHADSGARKLLIPLRGYALGRSVGLSRDGKSITYTETGTEGDIWLATLKK